VPSVLEGVFVCFLRLVFLASEFVFLYLEIVFQFVFFLECKLRVVQLNILFKKKIKKKKEYFDDG